MIGPWSQRFLRPEINHPETSEQVLSLAKLRTRGPILIVACVTAL